MQASSTPDRDTYRAIVLRVGGAQVLTVPIDDGRLRLPSVEVPRGQRVARNLTCALRREWGCEVVCLFTPETTLSGTDQTYWQVMEYWKGVENPRNRITWIPVSSLSSNAFGDSADYLVLQQSMKQLFQAPSKSPESFGRLGWFRELYSWVEEMIRPLQIELTGRFCQFNASPSFSLIRFDTTGPAVWFKAVGAPNQHEFPITIVLNRLCPRYLPPIIATRPAWRGWLMKDAGTPIADVIPTIDVWRQVAADLAGLQIESIGHVQELLRAGSRDLRVPRLVDSVDPFVETMDTLMQRQPKPSPRPLSSAELLELGQTLRNALDVADQIGIPATVGHCDFNPGNILWTGSGSLFIDWAEAFIGHPFFTFEYLVAHVRSHCPEVAPFEDFLGTAYTQVWKHIIPVQSIAETLVFSPLIAVFAYAVGTHCWHSPDVYTPHEEGYLRSLTRRMKHEADRVDTRRMTCLQC